MLEKNIATPKFSVGSVIDIKYVTGGLPNRIRVNMIFTTDNKIWKYDVTLESTGERTIMDESFISDRMVETSKGMFLLRAVRSRFRNGWRFAGNFSPDKADKFTEKYKNMVAHIRYTEAYDWYGKIVPNTVAVWIQYNKPIVASGDNEHTQGKTFTKDIK